MKYTFDRRGNNFLDIKKVDGKVIITISAEKTATQTTVNTSVLTLEQFNNIVAEINPPQENSTNAVENNVEKA